MNIARMNMLAMTSMLTAGASANVLMCSMEDESMNFSLADIAELDVSEVAEIRFESLPAGIYVFKITSAALDETTNRDNEQRFVAKFGLEIVEVKAVTKKDIDRDSLLGKTHNETLYIVPEKAPEGIGRIRAFLADMGAPNEGKLKPIIEDSVGTIFTGKIVEQKDKDDKSKIYARLKLEPAKK
jgi:hypothetical protein